ncbi:hypothetical protein [Aquimarina rhabdastrellae]
MKKIRFGDKDSLGRIVQEPIAINESYDLLAYFISDTKYNVEETIEELETIAQGRKTIDEITENTEWIISEDIGVFNCDRKKAYLKSKVSDFRDIEMPLREVINLLTEWKLFLKE